MQDAAHSTLLRNTRQLLHAQIAEALEAHATELIDSQPELFARHYAEAGMIEKSVAYWGTAGRRSVARSAMAEAAAQFQKALDQLELLPDSPERHRQELEIWRALGAVLTVVRGFAAPETGHAHARARELWDQLGSPSEFLQVPYGQSRYHAHRGEFDLALRLDEDLLRLSRQRNDSGGLVIGHLSSGRNRMLAGRFASSRSHLEEVLALHDPISACSLVDYAGDAPHVNSQALLGIVLFCLGYPDQALVQSSAAIAEARRLAHPRSLALSLSNGAIVLSLAGNNVVLGEWIEQLLAIATEQGFPYWRAQGTIYLGWVKVKNGDAAEGLSLLRSGSPYTKYLTPSPRRVDDDCLQELRWLYDRRDLPEARRDLAAWLAKWSDKYPKLTGWVEKNIDETLTFYRLPRQHHKHLKSTNMLERLNEEIKRRTHVVRIFPNGESCLRLVRAVAVETHENWFEQHRYLNMDDLREHKKEALRRAA